MLENTKGAYSCYKNYTVVITIWLIATKYPYLKWQWIFYFLRICFLSSITAKTIYRTWLYVWVTRQLSYMKQELLTLPGHLSSPPVFSILVGHHYRKTTTNNVNKTCALLQTTGDKDELNIGFMRVWSRNYLPFPGIWVHRRFFGGVHVVHLFSF
jgi:hypothetical protein